MDTIAEYDPMEYDDPTVGEMQWNDLVRQTQNVLDQYANEAGTWHVSGSNVGWQNTGGETTYSGTDAENILRALTPDTQPARIVVKDVGDGVQFTLYHHDSPTGEHHTFTPEE